MYYNLNDPSSVIVHSGLVVYVKLILIRVNFFVFSQARGPKKHLKRLNAPKSWMLDKLGGVFAPRPSAGPHKLRESLPLVIILRNRLKYALTYSEVIKIVMQRTIKIDGKVRTDKKFPAGFMGKFFFKFPLDRLTMLAMSVSGL